MQFVARGEFYDTKSFMHQDGAVKEKEPGRDPPDSHRFGGSGVHAAVPGSDGPVRTASVNSAFKDPHFTCPKVNVDVKRTGGVLARKTRQRVKNSFKKKGDI